MVAIVCSPEPETAAAPVRPVDALLEPELAVGLEFELKWRTTIQAPNATIAAIAITAPNRTGWRLRVSLIAGLSAGGIVRVEEVADPLPGRPVESASCCDSGSIVSVISNCLQGSIMSAP